MKGRKGSYEFPGEIRRYLIDLKSHRIQQEKNVDGSYEFPCVNPRHLCHRHRYAYCAVKRQESLYYSGIAIIDSDTFCVKTFDFGRDRFCGEPVFVPQPGYRYDPVSSQEPGWVLVEVYDSQAHQKSLAVFQTESLVDGPTSVVHLDCYVPLGLHGFWRSA
jgi:all-trans-8'-apo-beta-carotenal 15,15'-oxygenase